MRRRSVLSLSLCLVVGFCPFFRSASVEAKPRQEGFVAEPKNNAHRATYHLTGPRRAILGVPTNNERTHFTVNCAADPKKRGAQAIYVIDDGASYNGGTVVALRNGGGKDAKGQEITQGVSFGFVAKGETGIKWQALAGETIQPFLPHDVCTPEGTVIPLSEDVARVQSEALKAIAERHTTTPVFDKKATFILS